MGSPKKPPTKSSLPRGLSPDDCYFTENGTLVFTSNYHLKRGYCCKKKCKHCPWQGEK